MKYKILHIVGARPNFMKLAPVYEAIKMYSEVSQTVVHTGQHFDYNMSDVFFEQLNLPKPHINLEISGGSASQQIGKTILKLEQLLLEYNPNILCIYGDINATAASSIVASKLGIKIAHIEAGLRSFDNGMPEETNRIIADSLSDYFFTHSKEADENLIKEGKSADHIYFVGNVMIDTLIKALPIVENTKLRINLPEQYALVTLHRPSNVDNKENIVKLIEYFEEIGQKTPIVFPIHPRTKKTLGTYLEENIWHHIIFTEPMGYFEFIKLQKKAQYIITDSGGIQEESTYLHVPCFTLRNNTERPITMTQGSNILVGTKLDALQKALHTFFEGNVKESNIPELWDGKAGLRIAKVLVKLLSDK